MPESISQITPQEFTAQTAPGELAPAELVPIPSEGKAYPTDHPLANRTSVAVKSMTAREEDILTSRALIKSGKVISALIRSCIVEKRLDPDSMLAGDRNAVLVGIRILGYGSEYPCKYKCPNCSGEQEQIVQLAEMPLRRFPEGLWDNLPPNTNEFPFMLPTSKRQVTFRLLNGHDGDELSRIVDQGKKLQVQEELVTTRLRMQIVSISGERDPVKLLPLIRGMSARDSRALRKYIDTVTPGIDMKSQVHCNLCDWEGEVEVPIGTEFFWPET